MEIIAVDAMCGCGKTHNAIKKMCENKESKWIFVTPYLNEIQRVKTESKEKYNIEFVEPNGKYSKSEDFKSLLKEGKNIVTSHALFRDIDSDHYQLIKSGEYKMILDEVMQVIETTSYNAKDMEHMEKLGLLIDNNDGEYISSGKGYKGTIDGIKTIVKIAKKQRFFKYADGIYLWLFPAELIDCVQELTILTYMFEAQIMASYLKVYGFEYKLMTCTREEGFIPYKHVDTTEYANLIEIFSNKRFDRDDQNEFDYSASWWKNSKDNVIEEEKKLLYSFFFNHTDRDSELNMWTIFKGEEIREKDVITGKLQKKLSGKGYTTGFVSSSARATNEYSHKKFLAYMINKCQNPVIEGFLRSKGFTITKKQQNEFALSEMIQWIFRSRIRNKENIKIFVRSKRMRTLLQSWMIYGRVI